MQVKDKVVAWFFLHYIMPRAQIIDKPGFVVFKISQKTDVYSRQVVMPESLFASIEKHFTKKHGKMGEQALYSTGKKFGYRFSSVSHIATIKDTDKKGFLKYTNLMAKFIEGTYASSMLYSVDMDKPMIKFRLKDFVICELSGIGHIIKGGGSAGIWSYMTCNPRIEAVQPKCQGRGDPECEVIAAPLEVLKKYGKEVLTETNLKDLFLDNKYKVINEIQPTVHGKTSLKQLIDNRFFDFKNGILTYKGHRYFIIEVSLSYLLEKELKKLKNGEKDLFDLSFRHGKELTGKEKGQDPCKYVTDFMSALGWGDVFAIKKSGNYKVFTRNFPWTKWSRDSKFVIFRGMVSGMISGMENRKVILKKITKDPTSGHLNIAFGE